MTNHDEIKRRAEMDAKSIREVRKDLKDLAEAKQLARELLEAKRWLPTEDELYQMYFQTALNREAAIDSPSDDQTNTDQIEPADAHGLDENIRRVIEASGGNVSSEQLISWIDDGYIEKPYGVSMEATREIIRAIIPAFDSAESFRPTQKNVAVTARGTEKTVQRVCKHLKNEYGIGMVDEVQLPVR